MKSIEFLLESSLSRLYSKTQNHSVGAITAFRSEFSYNENMDRNRKLVNYLKNKKYDITSVDGSYIEQHGSPNAKEVRENSFFVVNPIEGDDQGQLENELVKLGKLFDQDSIMSYPFGSKPSLVGTSARDDAWPSLGQRHAFNNTTWGHAAGEFFSRVKGRKFAFNESYQVKYPGTINGIRGMKHAAEIVQQQLLDLGLD